MNKALGLIGRKEVGKLILLLFATVHSSQPLFSFSLSLSLSVSIYLSLYLSLYLSIYLPTCLPLSLSLSLSLFLLMLICFIFCPFYFPPHLFTLTHPHRPPPPPHAHFYYYIKRREKLFSFEHALLYPTVSAPASLLYLFFVWHVSPHVLTCVMEATFEPRYHFLVKR